MTYVRYVRCVRYVRYVEKVFAGLLLVAALAGGCGGPGGGHVLAARPGKITMQIDHLDAVRLDLPRGGAFYTTDLSKPRPGELKEVER